MQMLCSVRAAATNHATHSGAKLYVDAHAVAKNKKTFRDSRETDTPVLAAIVIFE